MKLPGEPLDSGFRFRPAEEHPPLPAEARRRVEDKIESVHQARLRAAAEAAHAVIG